MCFPTQAGRVGDQPGEGAPAEFGLRVESLTPDRASRVGMEGQRGVLVTEVDPASFADDLGFGRGDVIQEINHETVSSIEDYKRSGREAKTGSERGVQDPAARGQRTHVDRVPAGCSAGGQQTVVVSSIRSVDRYGLTAGLFGGPAAIFYTGVRNLWA